ncbi:MAG: uridine kinase [Flammeovirgaceae bacterium]
MNNNYKLFGICGSSGSGKSFIVKYVLENLGSNSVSVIFQDNYYKKREDQTRDQNGNYNFDLPSSFHLDEFINDLKRLKKGEKVDREEYTFNNPEVSPKVISVFPNKLILVEGLFLFNNKEIISLLDKTIFIDCSIEKMIQRRIKRDHQIRGYDKSDVIYKYENHVIPSYKKFILPYKETVDKVIDNDSDNPSGPESTLNYIIKESGLNNN